MANESNATNRRAAPAAAALEYRPLTVRSPDGLAISAQEWGNPKGPEILFIHGFSQSHLAWIGQIDSSLAQAFRMVTYDLRGHGNSDKPLDADKYRDPSRWADELQAVMDATGLQRPVLVAWSYGGRVVGDYLLNRGSERLSGINYVDATTKTDPSFFGEAMKVQSLMGSENIAVNFLATRDFLRACFETQPPPDEFDLMLGSSMMVPAKVRANLGGRPLDMDGTLMGLDLPVLVTHGAADRLIKVAMAEHTTRTIPGARLSVYDGAGHASFYEQPARFNTELASFVRDATRSQ